MRIERPGSSRVRQRPAWVVSSAALLLIGVVGATAAADPPEPAAAPAISAICGFEFAAVEKAVLLDDLAAGGDTDAPEAADSGEATAETPTGENTSETPTGENTSETSATAGPPPATAALDATIRGCASLDEWMAAAAQYPAALDGADGLSLLMARCADPDAGLDTYATCRSLAFALATPPPTPTATTAPTPKPVAVAPVSPAATPSPSSRTGTARKKPAKKQRVTVSRKQVASIPYATDIRYFGIRGSSPAQLLRNNQKRGNRHCGDHRAIACVLMSWDVSVTKRFDQDTRKCTVGKATTNLRATVYLPRWKTQKGASRDLIRWWRAVLTQSAVHEAQHIKIQRKHLSDFRKAVAGKPCGSTTILLNRHMARANRKQAAFDKVEYQKPLPALPPGLRP